MPEPSGRIIAGMIREGTPIENYLSEYGLYVKREDKACIPPGPPFSKARGVYAHLKKRPEEVICVLDTYHSQGGWAVARACQILGKQCRLYYPEFKYEPGPRLSQIEAAKLGAKLIGLPAGRSAILYHKMVKECAQLGGYPVPNALKLEESVTETAKEVPNQHYDYVLIPISSGTIAAGVIKGFQNRGLYATKFILHMGYSRSMLAVEQYVRAKSGLPVGSAPILLVNEGYSYKDVAASGETPPWPCNEFYDLKCFRWFQHNRERFAGKSTLLWNVG